MADVSFTAASIKPGTGAQTQEVRWGGTVTPGLVVYQAADGDYEAADCETSVLTAAAVGIALTGGGNGQWGVIQTGGALITSAHLSLASPVYILSVSGAICPAADLANNDYITIIGVAKSTTSLELCIKASGVQAAGIA